MAHGTRSEVWPPEFLALAGALHEDIPRPGQLRARRIKAVAIQDASQPLGAYASRLRDSIVVVTRGERAVAALVPLRNVDRESLLLSFHPDFLKIIRHAETQIAAGKCLTLAEVKSRFLRTRGQKAATERRGTRRPTR